MKFTRKIKKLIIGFVAVVSLATCAAGFTRPASATDNVSDNYHADQLDLNVKSAIAIDSHTGQLLYGKNVNQALPIASMTKLVTVYLTLQAIKQKKISWVTTVKPSAAIVKVANNSDYSNVPLKKGHSYTIKQLYEATLIESANGAAMCLAQAVAGSQTAFVKQMRHQLRNLKISDAQIYTVCGLPNGNLGKDAYPGVSKNAENKMSAKDMAIVGQNLLNDFPDVLDTTKIAHLDFIDGKKKTKMTNSDWMLKGLQQYDPALKVDGLKTGTTDAAGACFISTIKRNNARIITVVMGAKHRDGSDPSRFVQTKKLMNYIFSKYGPITFTKGQAIKGITTTKVKDGKQTSIGVGMQNNTEVWDPIDGKKLSTALLNKEVEAPVNKGQVVNYYTFKSGSEKLISLSQPDEMRLRAQALQSTGKVNFLVRFWRWLFGG